MKTRFNKLTAWLLTLAMLLTMLPGFTFTALAADNLCEHHAEHTAECGYVEGVSDCAYHCDVCLGHDHDGEEASEAVCDCGTDDAAIHATTCAVYVAPENPVCYCAEKCSEANIWCDVCGFDYSKCGGTDTAAVYENAECTHNFTDGTCTLCDTKAQAKVVDFETDATSYYATLPEALAAAEALDSSVGVNVYALAGYAGDFTITGNDITFYGDGYTFSGTVTNNGYIQGGTFSGTVTNNGYITGGTFSGTVTNNGYIQGDTFSGTVINPGSIYGGTFNGEVTNSGSIRGGTFNGHVINDGTVENTYSGVIALGEDFSIEGNGTIECNYHFWKDGTCRLCKVNCTHTGGKATCTSGAVCTTCGTEYIGKLDHVMDSNTGLCSNGCGVNMAEAKVTSGETDTYYETLASALNDSKSGDTVTLCKSVDIGNTEHTIPEGVTFYGGEYTVTGEGAGWVSNYGTIESGRFDFFVSNHGTVNGGSFDNIDCHPGSTLSGAVTITPTGRLVYRGECTIDLSNANLGGVDLSNATDQDLLIASLNLPDNYAVEVDGAVVSVLPAREDGNFVYHDHTYKPAFDETNHWMECACGKTTGEKVEHSFTYTGNGDTHTVGCSGCEYSKSEAHDFGTTGLCICTAQAQAKIGEIYYLTLAEAAAKVAGGETIEVLTDVTIGEEETVAFAAFAELDVLEGKTITCDGTVTIGEETGILFENQLYYLGALCANGYIGINLNTATPNTYYPAGEGYAIFEGNGILRLHNAVITTPDSDSTGHTDCIYSSGDLIICFSGNNQLTSGNTADATSGISVEGDLTLIAEGENAALTVQCGNSGGGPEGILAQSLTVNGGTVTAIGGSADGTPSAGIYVNTALTVNSGVVYAHGGSSGVWSFGVYTGIENMGSSTITVADGAALYATGGQGTIASAGVWAATVSGNVNATIFANVDETNVAYSVMGNGVVSVDTTAITQEGVTTTFTVPAGTSLTVNEGVTLDLSALEAGDIDFSGTVINKGTILLPEGFDIEKAPQSGAISIGDKSYTWNGEKWICGEGSHVEGTPATCTTQVVCDLCGASYGDTDPNNHTVGCTLSYEVTEEGKHTGTYSLCNATFTEPHDHTNGKCVCGAKATPVVVTAPTGISDLEYSGEPQALVTAGVASGGEVQYKVGEDGTYSAEIPTATDAGTHAVYWKVVGDSNHHDTAEQYIYVRIEAKDGSYANVTLEQESYQYDGTAKEPAVLSVVVDGKTLKEGTDYTVEYTDNIYVGNATVHIHFNGNYFGAALATFEITPREVTAPTFVGVEEIYLHTGSAIELTFTLKDDLGNEIAANEYTVAYSNNTEVGTATITITDNEDGNYNVSGTAQFTIAKHTHDWNISANGNVITATCQSTFGDCPNPTSTVTLVAPENLVYDGNDKVVITDGTIEGVTIPDVQYTGDRKNVGTFTASLTVDNVMATLSVTIEKAEVNNVSFDVTAPEALDEKQTTVTNGTGHTAAISWNTEAERFGFNTSYTATVTLTADGNHKFADTLSKDGWTVALNNDKTVATFTKTFDATRKQKIESVTAPTNVNLNSHKSDAAAVIATLPTTVSITLEENGTDNLTIEWSCANFNTAPLSENTFTWVATNNEYDSNNVALTGTITVTNPAANAVTITVKTENTSVVYNAADVDLTSLFDIDTNAGSATYTVTNGTGAGTQDGTALSVTKAGTFTVKVDTAANGIYAAGSQTATLTVNKAEGTGTVSMEGWTYGETEKAPAISGNKGEATYQYKARGADDSTYSSDKPSNAGEYTVKATFAETDLYNEAFATADFAIAKKDIAGATVGAFEQLTYTGEAQTPSATVTIGNLTVTGNWSNVTNVADTTTFTANGNFTGTIENQTTGMLKAVSSVTTTPNANTLTYNEAAQELITEGEANGGTIKYSLDNTTWAEAIPTGTDAGNYEVWYKVFGDANHNDTEAVKVDTSIAKKSIDSAIVLTAPVKNTVPQTEITGDGYTATVTWSPEVTDRFGYNTEYTAIITISVDENHTVTGIAENGYTVEGAKSVVNAAGSNEITVAYEKTGSRPSSGGGGGSNTTTTTTKNEDGSTTKTTTNKSTGTVTEVTTWPDGSSKTVETKKDGTVTTTEKDKDGNTTTTVEKPDGTSTTTEKNKDGSEKVTEEKADGTTVTTEKDADGTKTVTTENADGSTTTEETKKDGTKVTTETNADGEITAEVEAKGETEVVIPVDNAEDVTKVVVTDKDGKETEVEFEVKDGGVAISVSGDCTAVVNKAAKKVFDDVHPVNHWAIADVDYVFTKGLMNGVSETHFAPNDNLTRAMLVTVLYRLEGEPKVSGITSFADLEKDQYYLDAVCWAQINGIVNGTTDTTFAPNDNITREQIAAIMHRYAQYKGYDVSVGENTNILSYDDFDSISEYAIASMQYAVGSGLMKGKTTSTLNPLDNATRAEIAAILHRFIEANK